MWKFDSKISDLEETLWPRKLEVTVVCRETHVYAGKYCWKILKLCDVTGKVSCRTESISVWNTVLWDIAPREFSAKSPLEQYHMESPLNPISFNFSSKYSKQVLWGCVGVRRGPAVLFPPVSKKKYSKYPSSRCAILPFPGLQRNSAGYKKLPQNLLYPTSPLFYCSRLVKIKRALLGEILILCSIWF